MSTNPGAPVDQIRAVLQLVRTQLQILEIRHGHSAHPAAKQQLAADIRGLTEHARVLERILRSYTSGPSTPSSRLTRLSDCVAAIAASADPRRVDALEHVLAGQLADRIRTLESLAIAAGDRRLQQWTRGLHTSVAA